MRSLSIKTLRAGNISDLLKRRMYSVFERYYVDISYSRFCSDLAEKDDVLVFMNEKSVIGFSTILARKLPSIGRGMFIFSGDTVIDEEFQGRNILQKAFIKYLFISKLKNPFRPFYWMLISKGYITYLMMIRNFEFSFPRRNRKIPFHLQKLMDGFYKHRFGESYQPTKCLISFPESHGAVKADFASPGLSAFRNKDIQYFLLMNPEYQKGDELTCITVVRLRDLFKLVGKYFLSSWKKPGRSRSNVNSARTSQKKVPSK